MNPDGHYGLQCVDLADQYAQDIFGVPWSQSMGGVMGAKQLLDAAPDEYWIRIDDAAGIYPERGDTVVFAGSAINEWGHVCVCLESFPNGMWVAQQDGFAPPLIWADGNWYSNKPAHKAWLAYDSNGTGPVAGWLRPRENKLAGYTAPAPVVPAPPAVATNQRVSGAPVNQRTAAVRGDNVVKLWDTDLTFDFKGFVHGENVDGNDVWFVGAYSDTYFWSGGFTDASTNGLSDLTPAKPAPVASSKRVTVADGVNRRKAADAKGELIDTFGGDLELTIGGFVRSSSANSTPYNDGNNVWFVGGISGGYMHSSGFTDSSTQGLLDLTGTEPKVPVPTVPLPEVKPYSFVPDFAFVEYIPANITNVEIGKFPLKPEKTAIHQMGTPGVDTLGSTINEFKKASTFKSAHFAVSGKRIVQMVSLKDRAYHAGPQGNVYVGIETDPFQDAETIASVRKLIKAIYDKYGYVLTLIRHNEIPGNNTTCGTLIDLEDYKIEWPVKLEPAPTPTPTPLPPATVPPIEMDTAVTVLTKFFQWLINLYTSSKK